MIIISFFLHQQQFKMTIAVFVHVAVCSCLSVVLRSSVGWVNKWSDAHWKSDAEAFAVGTATSPGVIT